MQNLGLALLFSVGASLLGCSGETAVTAGVTGKWCGKKVSAAADCSSDAVELEYLELTQAASGVVTGVSCESFDKECYAVQSGNYTSGRLTYYYTFSSERVDGDFTSSDENTLTGTLHTTKCNCDVPVTFYRIP